MMLRRKEETKKDPATAQLRRQRKGLAQRYYTLKSFRRRHWTQHGISDVRKNLFSRYGGLKISDTEAADGGKAR